MQSSPTCGLGARYWAGLTIASVFGASLGDVLAHDLHLGHWRGLLPLAVLFGLILRGQRTGRVGSEASYWLLVVVVRAAATNVADLAAHDLHLGDAMLIAVLAVLFLVVGTMGSRSPLDAGTGSPVGTARGLPDTRGSYWITLFLAGTLGTVLGDDASGRFGLGTASILLGTILGILLCRRMRVAGNKAGYWSTVLAARTAGTSIGDWLADRSGVGLDGSTAMLGAVLLILLLAWPRSERYRPGVTAT